MKFEEAKKRIVDLKTLINKWSIEYYEDDAPTVDDSVYDKTYAELVNLEHDFPMLKTEDSPTQRVGGDNLSSSFEKTKHEIPMLSLENAFDNDKLINFDNQIKKEAKDYSFFVEPKIDGISISLIYENGILVKALTRGNGIEGEDVTVNAKQIKSIPQKIDFEGNINIRGEVFMSNASFEKINNRRLDEGDVPLANPRNAAAGTMRQLDSRVVKERELDMIAYWAMTSQDDYAWETQAETIKNLKSFGFNVAEISKSAKDIQEVIEVIEYITKQKDKIDYEIDGIVIKINESWLYDEIGYTSKFPKWAIAYKFPAEVKATKLLNIFPTVGRTGRVTYNALLEEVELAGTKVQRATLHNSDYITQLDLRIGDIVNVKKAGEIIPKVISSNHEKRDGTQVKWTEDKVCPYCSTEFIRKEGEVDQYCPNKHCSSVMKESIIHFASRDAMNIEGLSTKQIEKFINKGWIDSFSDIYKLKDLKEDILALEGYQEKSVNSLINSIEASKDNGLDKLLFGLGIRHIGKKTAKDLAREYRSLEKLFGISLDELLMKNDLGEVKSNSIIKFFNNEENISEIKKLIELGINPTMEEIEVDTNHFLYNKKVVVTGTINGLNRQQVKEELGRFGAQITTSVSGTTDYLIIGEKPSPSKVAKMDENKVIKFEDIDKIVV